MYRLQAATDLKSHKCRLPEVVRRLLPSARRRRAWTDSLKTPSTMLNPFPTSASNNIICCRTPPIMPTATKGTSLTLELPRRMIRARKLLLPRSWITRLLLVVPVGMLEPLTKTFAMLPRSTRMHTRCRLVTLLNFRPHVCATYPCPTRPKHTRLSSLSPPVLILELTFPKF